MPNLIDERKTYALLMGKIPFAKIGEVRAEQTVFCPVEQLVCVKPKLERFTAFTKKFKKNTQRELIN